MKKKGQHASGESVESLLGRTQAAPDDSINYVEHLNKEIKEQKKYIAILELTKKEWTKLAFLSGALVGLLYSVVIKYLLY